VKPTFFRTPLAFRQWLERHHASADALVVGFYKKDCGKPTMTWPQSVDEALCFGWIDGIRKSVDAVSYTIRFTPRKSGSVWSNVNMKRGAVLIERGLMRPAGLKAFEARKENRSGIYSYEQRTANLEPPYERLLKKDRRARDHFYSQAPSYRKAIGWWILSAKKEETRVKRMEKLIAYSARGERLPEFLSRKIPGTA
jgi:uncharacterized protein YdeI (YjbR/CyaY-like superfamily)